MSATAADAPPLAPGAAPEVRDSITLTPKERELFDTLLAAVAQAGTGTALRCAGGWVRDKLLGRDSDDIDIALDNMLGKDFAERVNEYLAGQGREVRHAAVIQSNPDQSKHLETARMKISDVWVDLVNLRSETYAADSRIPSMEFGTPQQDALRRDFTINALFYNLSAGGVVEDLTGHGLADLRAGLLRTPLPPLETFLDDPLRVLRAVRFATRFGFKLHPDIVEAASAEKVRSALGGKVSKERVGTELEGMFNGPSPVEAVRLLQRLGIFGIVFALPHPLDAALGTRWGAPSVVCMAAADELAAAVLAEQPDKEARRFYLLAALMLPLRGLQAPAGPKGKHVAAAAALIRDAIKWRVKDIEMVAALHEGAQEFAHALKLLRDAPTATDSAADGTTPDVRVVLGGALRKLKQHWRLGLLLAPLLAMPEATPLSAGANDGPIGASAASADDGAGGVGGMEVAQGASGARCEAARELLAAVDAYGLAECWGWKPLLDGKQLMSLLGWSRPGPEMGRVLGTVMEWQLVEPALTLEECQRRIKERFGAGAGSSMEQ